MRQFGLAVGCFGVVPSFAVNAKCCVGVHEQMSGGGKGQQKE